LSPRAAAFRQNRRMLTVAVTGPTGEIGRAFISSLERVPEVERVIGMARRPFDLAGHGWEKTEYRRGDVLDREAVDSLVEDADVVVHLAFAIVAGDSASREVNLNGSRNVFEATAAAGAKRLVYTSSVAAYGFHRGMPALLDEDEPVRGSSRHPYSAHKAAVEAELDEALLDSHTESFVFRPCIVAGPEATLLLDLIPLLAMGQRIPGPLRWALGRVPELRPVLPDPGVPFRGGPRPRPARRLQPRRPRSADDHRLGPCPWLARGARPAPGGWRRR
jgi:UDP-glucose 4-epimerase